MDDLFSVFEAPTASGSGSAAASTSNGTSSAADGHKAKRQKRSAVETADPAPKPLKKAKAAQIDPPKPTSAPVVATDEFEQEQTREVADSGGLAGAAGQGPVRLSHQVRHQVAIPPGFPYTPINRHVMSDPPARSYGFTLDPFQATSIASIDRNESVLVSAHTSAGKTVVAEYAIAQCLRDKQRVIYTSPIKALSNQKYRDFMGEFGDVGLMTGDVTINPSASCLVMTTEERSTILRSMLYRGSEIMREVAWVVFDEIHYMRDAERGVVWEETIILLPHKVRYVFLSATIPNALEFAEWICKTHEQPCHVVYTDFRPTPLQHYLFPANGDGIHLVVDEKSVFREENFQKAMGTLSDGRGEDPADSRGGKGRKGKTKKGGQKGGPTDIYKIVKMIMVKNYNPVIVFAFSKRETESLALSMAKLEFTTDSEREMIASVFNNAIAGLSDDDRMLPQIEHILPLLKRGIGIHHGGLLPLLKEVIEILFQEGLIKVLFATETFSIGLNMPAKTVVFTNVRKFDGKDFRNLSSGEYIQMSGRAGRRGLDDRGIVVMMVDEKLEPSAARKMVQGTADRLDSAFRLGYNMILNLKGVSPDFILHRSFFQFQNAASVPRLEAELQELSAQHAAMAVEQESEIAEYYNLRKQLDAFAQDARDCVNHPTYALPFLQPGRLLRVKADDIDFGWGVCVNFSKRTGPKGRPLNDELPQKQYIVDVLLNCALPQNKREDLPALANGIRPCEPGEDGEYVVVPVLLATIDGISHLRIFLPKDIKPAEPRTTVAKTVAEVKRRFPDGIDVLDPVNNMGIKDEAFLKLLKRIEILEGKLAEHELHQSPRLSALYDAYAEKVVLQNKVADLTRRIAAAHSVLHLDELKHRKRLLRRLEFSTADDVVSLKGRVACEISTGDELLLTQLIFDGVFTDLSPEQAAAICSCFVFQDKSEARGTLRDELNGPLLKLREAAQRIARVAVECKLEMDEQLYVASFKPELMDAVFKWCKGASFETVCKMTDVMEGTVVRVFRRLQELLRQLALAGKAMGSESLEQLFVSALECLERPSSVVFSASLYL